MILILNLYFRLTTTPHPGPAEDHHRAGPAPPLCRGEGGVGDWADQGPGGQLLAGGQDIRRHRQQPDVLQVPDRPGLGRNQGGNSTGFFWSRNGPKLGPRTGPKCHLKRLPA